jgi:hypothetical protein
VDSAKESAMIGAKVGWAHVPGLRRYGRIIAVSEADDLVQVAWEAWPAYLITLPYPSEADRNFCLPHRSWIDAPGSERRA